MASAPISRVLEDMDFWQILWQPYFLQQRQKSFICDIMQSKCSRIETAVDTEGILSLRRFTMDLGPKFDKVLTDLAESKEVPKSEIIRRAVAYYSLLEDERSAGKKITLVDERNKTVQEVLLP